MDEQRGEALRAPAHVIVEVDAPLRYSDMAVPEPMSWQHAVQAMPCSATTPRNRASHTRG